MNTTPAPAGHRLSVNAVEKRFGALRALDGVSFDVEPGTFLVLLGPSGSGKTTLLRGLAGIERFDAGTVTIGPHVVSDARRHVPAEKRGLAMVFQDYALWPHLTVAENVGYALRRQKLDAREVDRRTRETLERVNMAEKGASYPQELSGGQQQRVALARAIVARPALLLFDEPLSNLDAHLREHLRVEIATLTRETGATAVYITHDQSEAFALADVVGVLNAGKLEQFGTPESIYSTPASPFVARFTGLSGTLPGILDRRVDDSTALIRIGDHRIAASAAAALNPGAEVEVAIRPAAPRLVDPSAHHDRGQSGDTLLAGWVTDTAYRGRGYEHVVRTDHGELTGVFDTRGWGRGAACLIAIAPEACIAFPRAA
ncbi:MAG: ABC transporter ATP-binding protein [Microbacteriaceae bacterium]|nr:ABC transporter ATP-binding protein [Microbacteriaceae bacterium]MCL2795594.1 ABC transporter ATP-binding protein [Microbacteriaceae bacterium]